MRWRGPAARSLVRSDGAPGARPSRTDRRDGAAGLHSEDGLHPWSRYVALGDSFTEGVGDPEPASAGGLRGWADRVAEELAAGRADFGYANLAVRGLLLQQIMDQQIGKALALQPDLVTLSAGGNDMVFHGTDPDKLAAKLEAGVSQLAQAGPTIVLFTGPDWGSTLVLGRNRAKVAIFNENVRALAARHGAVIADLWALTQLGTTGCGTLTGCTSRRWDITLLPWRYWKPSTFRTPFSHWSPRVCRQAVGVRQGQATCPGPGHTLSPGWSGSSAPTERTRSCAPSARTPALCFRPKTRRHQPWPT
ncbi:MAG: Lysophospholipase [Pseudarthrobacter sp.]|nr:Lysophospholipase [Pseudarthrobacter sp.]